MTADPLRPSASLLVKLGSIVVHFDESTGPGGHPYDVVAARQLVEDPEVAEWLAAMDAASFLPKKRT